MRDGVIEGNIGGMGAWGMGGSEEVLDEGNRQQDESAQKTETIGK
jgi:hypothetical protein